MKNKERLLKKSKEYRQNNLWKWKEYNRRAYAKYPERILEKRRLNKEKLDEYRHRAWVALGTSICMICGKGKRRLELHHKFYDPEGDPYKRSDISKYRARREIVDEAIAHPERFALLCNPCHQRVTCFSKDPEQLQRLLEIVKATVGR